MWTPGCFCIFINYLISILANQTNCSCLKCCTSRTTHCFKRACDHDQVCTLHPTQTVITSNYNACSRTLTSLVKPLQANGDSELRSKHSTSQPPPALSFTSDKTWSRCDSLEAIAVFWLKASPEVSVSTRKQLDDNSWTRPFASLLSYKAFVGFLNRHRYFCLFLENQYIHFATD